MLNDFVNNRPYRNPRGHRANNPLTRPYGYYALEEQISSPRPTTDVCLENCFDRIQFFGYPMVRNEKLTSNTRKRLRKTRDQDSISTNFIVGTSRVINRKRVQRSVR